MNANINAEKIASFSIGDVFYECEAGFNIEARVTSVPVETDFDGKRQFSWAAENTQTGENIDYLWTDGLSHYGPRLYPHPQYTRVAAGKIEYPLVGAA